MRLNESMQLKVGVGFLAVWGGKQGEKEKAKIVFILFSALSHPTSICDSANKTTATTTFVLKPAVETCHY